MCRVARNCNYIYISREGP